MLNFPQLSFFLGSNTPQGFYSLFHEFYNPNEDHRMYIIKGGPGTGKSCLMKTVAEIVEKEGYLCERIPCSSDPDSLDGVMFPELCASIADGTSPHVIEPRFPGAVEQFVNLGEFWNTATLRRHAAEIRRLTIAASDEHRRCVQFLSAVKAIDNDSFRTVRQCVDTPKIENYAKRLAGREFAVREHQKSGRGVEKRRFLSALSPKGVFVLFDSVRLLCDKIFAVKDEYGLCASVLLENLKENALGRGYDVIACYCPIHPEEKLEHLFVPELGIGFFTENSYHSLPFEPTKKIHTKRFMDTVQLSESLCRLRFNSKARRDLIHEAVCRLELAKSIHDKLETYYIKSMDFKRVQKAALKIADEILSGV
ncbi:MAG: hypothetical protein LBS36_00155 [Oscillospiraceae bacterium]|jgi:hypothetical protein|nr:hypothetical protein [Oscillospiraceae bacterium]